MSETRKNLDAQIPAEAVTTRESYKGGPKLSYLTGAYVINRLNEILGQGNWSYGIEEMTKVFEGKIEQYSGEAFTVSYISRIWFNADIDGRRSSFTEVGYGDGTDKKSPGKAHELATKEAVTDGLKRAAKNLGISMGLGLYFKSGEYVDEQNEKNEPTKREETKANPEAPKKSSTKNTKPDAKIFKEQIKSSFAVLQAQKKITKEDFIKTYLNGGKTDDLTDQAVTEVLGKLKENFPELGL